MSAGEQGDDHALEQMVLPHDDLFYFVQHTFHREFVLTV
jgi:hypothetical protein